MKVGVPKEVKNHEYRVAITPAGVHELTRAGHQVFIQQDAGTGSAIPDEDFVAAGAAILPTADDVWTASELVLKVKEPVAEEYHRMRKGQVEVGEQNLPLAHPVVLLRHRLLDLEHELARGPYVVGGRQDRRPGGDEVLVGDRRAGPGVLLDEYLVTRTGQFMHACRRDRYPVLVVLDLCGDPYLHDRSPFLPSRRPRCRAVRS